MENSAQVISFFYSIFDSKGNFVQPKQKTPVSIVVGKRQIFKKLEDWLIKLNPQAKHRIPLSADEAFGHYDSDLTMTIPKSNFDKNAVVGDTYMVDLDDGESVKMILSSEDEDYFLLDGNHQLAGLDLLFEVEVVGKRLATRKELKTGETIFKKLNKCNGTFA